MLLAFSLISTIHSTIGDLHNDAEHRYDTWRAPTVLPAVGAIRMPPNTKRDWRNPNHPHQKKSRNALRKDQYDMLDEVNMGYVLGGIHPIFTAQLM